MGKLATRWALARLVSPVRSRREAMGVGDGRGVGLGIISVVVVFAGVGEIMDMPGEGITSDPGVEIAGMVRVGVGWVRKIRITPICRNSRIWARTGGTASRPDRRVITNTSTQVRRRTEDLAGRRAGRASRRWVTARAISGGEGEGKARPAAVR